MTVVSLEGENGTFKTGVSYTAPPPIIGCQFDLGFERAVYGVKFKELFSMLDIVERNHDEVEWTPEGLKKLWTRGPNAVTVIHFPKPIQIGERLNGVEAMWQKYAMLTGAFLRDPYMRSMVTDTMTEARRVSADGWLESLQAKEPGRKQLIQIEWGGPDGRVREIYQNAKSVPGKNFIVTHHLTDERQEFINERGQKDSFVTGKKLLEGLRKTYEQVDLALRFELAQVDDVYNPGQRKTSVKGTFTKCGYNLALTGSSILDPTWDKIMTTVNDTLGRPILPLRGEVDG